LRIVVQPKYAHISTSSLGHDAQYIHQKRYPLPVIFKDHLTLEHRELNELKTVSEIIDWLDEQFVVKRSRDEGFGMAISMEGIRRG
jgi:hypothetical protein